MHDLTRWRDKNVGNTKKLWAKTPQSHRPRENRKQSTTKTFAPKPPAKGDYEIDDEEERYDYGLRDTTTKKNVMATASWVKTKIAGTQRRTTTKNEAYAKKTRAVTRHETFDTDLDRWTSRLHSTGLRIGLKKLSITSTDRGGRLRGIFASSRRLPARRWLFRSQDIDIIDDGGCPAPEHLPERNDIIIIYDFSPLLSFYDQLRTLRQNSNLPYVFELRPDLANVGGPSDFVESNCSASSTASFDQRKLSPRRQHLRQPNWRRYPF